MITSEADLARRLGAAPEPVSDVAADALLRGAARRLRRRRATRMGVVAVIAAIGVAGGLWHPTGSGPAAPSVANAEQVFTAQACPTTATVHSESVGGAGAVGGPFLPKGVQAISVCRYEDTRLSPLNPQEGVIGYRKAPHAPLASGVSVAPQDVGPLFRALDREAPASALPAGCHPKLGGTTQLVLLYPNGTTVTFDVIGGCSGQTLATAGHVVTLTAEQVAALIPPDPNA